MSAVAAMTQTAERQNCAAAAVFPYSPGCCIPVTSNPYTTT